MREREQEAEKPMSYERNKLGERFWEACLVFLWFVSLCLHLFAVANLWLTLLNWQTVYAEYTIVAAMEIVCFVLMAKYWAELNRRWHAMLTEWTFDLNCRSRLFITATKSRGIAYPLLLSPRNLSHLIFLSSRFETIHLGEWANNGFPWPKQNCEGQ